MMTILTKAEAAQLVKYGLFDWLSDEDFNNLSHFGLDPDCDIDPCTGRFVFLYVNDDGKFRGIRATFEGVDNLHFDLTNHEEL